MQEITVLHGCLISIPKFSQKCRTAFVKLLHVKFISWVYILRFYAHTCTRCAPVFFILFLVSVGSIEQHSCESQQIVARRRLSKWCRKGVIPTSLFIWSLHEHRQDNPDWVATGKRVFSSLTLKTLRKKNYYDKRMMMKLGFLIVQTIVAKVVSTLVALIKWMKNVITEFFQ